MKLALNHIAIEVTSVCNLNCKYCYNIWKMPDTEYVHSNINTYTQTIKTLKRLFKLADIKQIAFTGGEPFMAERFLEIVLFCRMKGKSITIISNGTYAKDDDYKQLINIGVGLFEIPIHSDNFKIHDAMTQQNGSWEKSQHSIKYITENGGYVVPVIVLTKFNAEVIEDTLRFISSLGLKRIMLNRYNIGGHGVKAPLDVSPTIKEIQNAFEIANSVSKELNLIISSNVCTPRCVLNPKDYNNIAFGNCSTNVLNRPITLDIKGDMRLCNHSPIVAGNIYKQDLPEILFSPYSEKWENEIPDYCIECNLWYQCLGGCRAASEQMNMSLSTVDPICNI